MTCNAQGPIRINYKTISPTEIKQPKYATFEEFFGTDHYLTFVTVQGLPEKGAALHVHINRPLFKGTKMEVIDQDLPHEELMKTKNPLFGGLPAHIVQGLGFPPGEKIEMYIESGGIRSNTITFYPYPIATKSRIDNAKLSVSFESFAVTLYKLDFENFLSEEEVEFVSESSGEVISYKFVVNPKNCTSLLSPAVVNKTGGLNNVSIKRKNGETLKVVIPWGTESAKWTLKGMERFTK